MMGDGSLYCGVDTFFFFKQKTAYEMRISDWSSDVCSSDLATDIAPSLTWGTSPEDVVAITGTVPDPESFADASKRAAARKSLDYMGLAPGMRMQDVGVQQIGRAHVELQSLMRISYAVFCLKKKKLPMTTEYTTHRQSHT